MIRFYIMATCYLSVATALLDAETQAFKAATQGIPSIGLDRLPGAQLGAIDARLYRTNTPLMVDAWREQIVVIQTFATWCPPCKSAMRHYDKVLHALKDRGIVFIALSFDTDADLFEKWMRDSGSKFHAIFARANLTKQSAGQIFDDPTMAPPGFYFVNRTGKIIVAYNGFSEEYLGPTGYDPRLGVALAAAGIELSRDERRQIRAGP